MRDVAVRMEAWLQEEKPEQGSPASLQPMERVYPRATAGAGAHAAEELCTAAATIANNIKVLVWGRGSGVLVWGRGTGVLSAAHTHSAHMQHTHTHSAHMQRTHTHTRPHAAHTHSAHMQHTHTRPTCNALLHSVLCVVVYVREGGGEVSSIPVRCSCMEMGGGHEGA